MRIVLQIVSWLALAATIVPSMVYLGGAIELNAVQTIMFGATIVWFVALPLSIYFKPRETGVTP
jgi:hypothetical protein